MHQATIVSDETNKSKLKWNKKQRKLNYRFASEQLPLHGMSSNEMNESRTDFFWRASANIVMEYNKFKKYCTILHE